MPDALTKPDPPKIPDQFYKSRVTCFAMSLLAFVASIAKEPDIAALPIFGIKPSAIDIHLVIVFLITGAFVSLLSVYALYRDAILPHLIHAMDLKPHIPSVQIAEAADKAIAKVQETQGIINHAINQPDLINLIRQGAVTLQTAEARRVIDNIVQMDFLKETVAQAQSLYLSMESFDAARRAASGFEEEYGVSHQWNYLKDQSADFIGRIDDHKDLMLQRFSDPKFKIVWDGNSIGDRLWSIEAQQHSAVADVRSLTGQLYRYNRTVRSSLFWKKLEYFWIQVGAPALVFSIACAHAIGRLFGIQTSTLPEWTKYIFA